MNGFRMMQLKYPNFHHHYEEIFGCSGLSAATLYNMRMFGWGRKVIMPVTRKCMNISYFLEHEIKVR